MGGHEGLCVCVGGWVSGRQGCVVVCVRVCVCGWRCVCVCVSVCAKS